MTIDVQEVAWESDPLQASHQLAAENPTDSCFATSYRIEREHKTQRLVMSPTNRLSSIESVPPYDESPSLESTFHQASSHAPHTPRFPGSRGYCHLFRGNQLFRVKSQLSMLGTHGSTMHHHTVRRPWINRRNVIGKNGLVMRWSCRSRF